MLRQATVRGIVIAQRFLRHRFARMFSNENTSDDSPLWNPQNDMKRMHGAFKEEKYFLEENSKILNKLKETGAKLKCEECDEPAGNFDFKEMPTSAEGTIRETCYLNPNKNCGEEAYFLKEHLDTMKLWKDKLEADVIDIDENANKDDAMFQNRENSGAIEEQEEGHSTPKNEIESGEIQKESENEEDNNKN